MAHYNYKIQQNEEQGPFTPTTEQKVDCLFSQIISSLFEIFDDPDLGPVEFTTNYELTEEQFELLCKDSRGIDAFQTRLLDILDIVVKNLTLFNGKPTNDLTTITLICDFIFDESDDTGYPYVLSIGLKEIR